ADLAKTAQLDFIALGNLQSGAADYGVGGYTSEILFIPGASFETDGGQIFSMNLHSPGDSGKDARRAISMIHHQGGVEFAASPSGFRSDRDYALADGMEVYNQEEQWDSESRRSLYLRALFFPTDRFLLDLARRPETSLELFDKMAAGARVSLIAGIGGAEDMTVLGSKVGTRSQLFLFSSVHLLTRGRYLSR